jgi:hypothetical protein
MHMDDNQVQFWKQQSPRFPTLDGRYMEYNQQQSKKAEFPIELNWGHDPNVTFLSCLHPLKQSFPTKLNREPSSNFAFLSLWQFRKQLFPKFSTLGGIHIFSNNQQLEKVALPIELNREPLSNATALKSWQFAKHPLPILSTLAGMFA